MKYLRRLLHFHKEFCRRLSTSEHPLTTASIAQRQNDLFEEEKHRQLNMVKRIEKITVHHVGPVDSCKLAMNKHLSTPYHVAMHFNENYMKRSALALVNGKPWHMLQPLTEDCELRLVHLKDDEPQIVNEAFWRSCGHMTGAILQTAFKEDVYVEPARNPNIPVSQGCFAYDINLSFKWEPSREELVCLSRLAYELIEKRLPFERLEVRRTIAMEIFQDNEYKTAELEATDSGRVVTDSGRVVIFRLGQFIDISPGPMVANTGFMVPHRFSITRVQHIDDYKKAGNELTRFQGIALPTEFPCHYHTWNLIEDRAKKPVTTNISVQTES